MHTCAYLLRQDAKINSNFNRMFVFLTNRGGKIRNRLFAKNKV